MTPLPQALADSVTVITDAGLPPIVAAIAGFVDPWKTMYADSKVLPVAVLFAHLGALFIGGGLALAADRYTLRHAGGTTAGAIDAGAVDAGTENARGRVLSELAGIHRPVVVALGVVFLSGMLLLLSDVETFWASTAFWVKMGLVSALLINGYLMTRVEATLATAPSPTGSWSRLRGHARASALLWLATVLAGVILANS